MAESASGSRPSGKIGSLFVKELVAALVVASVLVTACGGGDDDTSAAPGPVELRPATEGVPGVMIVPVSGDRHVSGQVSYPTSPPAGGNHNAVWQNCGFYSTTVTNELAVHSLEHGAVWITYVASIADTVKSDLMAKAKASPYILASLYPDNPTPIVVSAWGRQLQMQTYDSALVDQFLDVYGVDGPTVPEKRGLCRRGVGVPPDRPLSGA
jgi:hypothetical protein